MIWQWVTSNFAPHQPRDVLRKGEDLISLFDNELANFSNVGKLGKKKGKYYAQISLGHLNISLANGDTIEPYLNIASSHDGSVATRYFLSFVKISCQNTFMHAIRTADIEKTFKVKQTKNNALDNPNIVNVMAETLGFIQNQIDVVQGDINLMIETPMTMDEMIDYWCELEGMSNIPQEKIPNGQFNKDGSEKMIVKQGTRSTRQENILSSILACYAKEVNELGTPSETAYAAWNAYTGYQDHIKVLKTDKQGRITVSADSMAQNVIGVSADRKAKAYKMALTVS